MCLGSLSTKMMGKKDERVEVCSEVLKGIRTLKMHVWEEHFLSKILRKCYISENVAHFFFHLLEFYAPQLHLLTGIRESELHYLKGRKYLDALCVFFWATTPVIIAVLTFTCYCLIGGQLNAARVSVQ